MLRCVLFCLSCVSLLGLTANAEPFYGSLDKEVNAFIGSYAYVSSGTGASEDAILRAKSRCDTPMTGTNVPAQFAKGDFAFYRDDAGEIWIEGPRIQGRYEVMSVSDAVQDARSNFTFRFNREGIGGTGEVEIGHFHRDHGIYAGVLITGHSRVSGSWVVCAAVMPRYVDPE